jgi:hypothetical protein
MIMHVAFDHAVYAQSVFLAGTDFLGGCSPKAFGTPANYIYFDLIVSYLIILTTKYVKLPILWSWSDLAMQA